MFITPEHKNLVVPYIIIDDVEHFLDFAEKVFETRIEGVVKRKNGTILHAEVSINETLIFLGEADEKSDIFPASLFIYVPNCDDVYNACLKNGARSIMKPKDVWHTGERFGGIADPFGNIWWIASVKEKLTFRQQQERVNNSLE